MYNKLRYLVIFFCLTSLTACWKNDLKEYFGREGMMTPRPYRLGQMPQGDDPYSQGVRDGCNTALSVVGTGFLNTMYDPSYVDFEKNVNDNEYYQGRVLGFNYCTFFLDVEPL